MTLPTKFTNMVTFCFTTNIVGNVRETNKYCGLVRYSLGINYMKYTGKVSGSPNSKKI